MKASLGEVSSSQVSFGKIGLGTVDPSKISPTEIWPYLRMRRSPLIPDRYSLLACGRVIDLPWLILPLLDCARECAFVRYSLYPSGRYT